MFDASSLQLLDAVNFGFSVQEMIIQGIESCAPGAGMLHGSAFHAVTAAFATLGYYAQAEVMEFLGGSFGKLATLIYIIAGIGGIGSMAMGQPPKNWVWFFIGPALFHFICGTPDASRGVAWMIGPYIQNQAEVWKLVETGAVNTSWALRQDSGDPWGKGFNNGGFDFSVNTGPTDPVLVSMPFLVFDTFVSDTVRQLSHWLGITYQVNSEISLGNSDSSETNIGLAPRANDVFGRAPPNGEVCDNAVRHPAALTNLKWSYLNSIVSASMSSPNARDLFSRFMVNECGEALTSVINDSQYAAAANQQGDWLPNTVFKYDDPSPADGTHNINYGQLRSALARKWVPIPESFRALFRANEDLAIHDFLYAIGHHDDNPVSRPEIALRIDQILQGDRVRCDTLLYTILLYFRYEAAHIYLNSFQNTNPAGWDSYDIAYFVLYGWDIPYTEMGAGSCNAEGLSDGHQELFIYNLILAHLFRNEMRKLPELVTVRKNSSQQIIEDSQLHHATVGSVSKFAEVYTWALMIPYIQGLGLYVLTLAFPFCGVLLLFPGFHKVLFVWMKFFVWLKSLDVGFAVVSSIEKPLWAMMANSSTIRAANARVLEMIDFGGFLITDCTFPPGAFDTGRLVCNNPELHLTGGWGAICSATDGNPPLDVFDGANVASANYTGYDPATDLTAISSAFDASLRLFDISLILGNTLNFDIANGYYIYIMTGFYFAMPGIMGQLILGAHAGAAQFLDKIASDPAGKSASAAQTGHQSREALSIKQNAASASQESMAAGHRKSGLVHKALDQQNQAAAHGMLAAQQGQIEQGYGRYKNANALNMSTLRAHYDADSAAFKALLGAPLKDSDPVSKLNNQATKEPGRYSGSSAGEQTPGNTIGDAGTGADGNKGAEYPAHQQQSAIDAQNNRQNAGGGGQILDPKGGLISDGHGSMSGVTAEQRAHKTQASKVAEQFGNPTAAAHRKFGGVKGIGAYSKALGDQFKGPLGNMDLGGGLSIAGAGAIAEWQHLTNQRDNEFSARAGEAAIQGNFHNQVSSGFRSASDRSMAQANFAAASNNFDVMSKFAARSAQFSITAGLPPAALQPDKRPEDAMGMAMVGMLDAPGRATRNAGNYFDPKGGTFMRDVAQGTRNLHQQFGYRAVQSQYHRPNPGQSLINAARHGSQYFSNMGFGMYSAGQGAQTPGNQRSSAPTPPPKPLS